MHVLLEEYLYGPLNRLGIDDIYLAFSFRNLKGNSNDGIETSEGTWATEEQ